MLADIWNDIQYSQQFKSFYILCRPLTSSSLSLSYSQLIHGVSLLEFFASSQQKKVDVDWDFLLTCQFYTFPAWTYFFVKWVETVTMTGREVIKICLIKDLNLWIILEIASLTPIFRNSCMDIFSSFIVINNSN